VRLPAAGAAETLLGLHFTHYKYKLTMIHAAGDQHIMHISADVLFDNIIPVNQSIKILKAPNEQQHKSSRIPAQPHGQQTPRRREASQAWGTKSESRKRWVRDSLYINTRFILQKRAKNCRYHHLYNKEGAPRVRACAGAAESLHAYTYKKETRTRDRSRLLLLYTIKVTIPIPISRKSVRAPK